MNKKAQIAKGWFWIVRIILIIIPLVFAITFFTAKFIGTLDATPIEAIILSDRISGCFSKNAGVISAEKFNTENAEKCFNNWLDGSIRANLFFSGKNIETKTSQFNYFEPLCFFTDRNAPYCAEFKEYVLVEENGVIYPGTLEIKITLTKNV